MAGELARAARNRGTAPIKSARLNLCPGEVEVDRDVSRIKRVGTGQFLKGSCHLILREQDRAERGVCSRHVRGQLDRTFEGNPGLVQVA